MKRTEVHHGSLTLVLSRSVIRLFHVQIMKTEVETVTAGPSPAAAHHPTTAGNYFVSNYPPFSFWRPDAVGDFFAALQTPPEPGTPLGIYLHIPFCRKRCHFCYFRVYTDKDSTAIKGYIEAALSELALYARQPALAGRKPSFVYFGGGTPRFLSANHFDTDRRNEIAPADGARPRKSRSNASRGL